MAEANTQPKRHAVRWPFVLVACALGLYAIWRLFFNNLEALTSAQLDAYLHGDTEEMYATSTQEEQRLTGLTESALNSLWLELVQPRLKLVTVLDERTVRLLNDPPDQGMAEVKIRFASGLTSSIGVGLYPTEAKPKRPVLFDTLLTAWFIASQSEREHPLSIREIFEGRLACLRADRPTLERLGLKGVFEVRSGFLSWEQMERNLVDYLSKPDALDSPTTSSR